MLSKPEFVRGSLETNLFWARIMKEHAIFLHAGMVCKDVGLIQESMVYQNYFSSLLTDTLYLSNDVVPPESVASRQYVTNNTLAAEQKVMELTGIPIDLSITKAEMKLRGGHNYYPQLDNAVYALNQEAIAATAAFADFLSRLYDQQVACNIFTWLFPALIDHLRRETLMYNTMLTYLQNFQEPHEIAMAPKLESFWDHIMGDHATQIKQMLDPSEKALQNTADAYSKQFEELASEAAALGADPAAINELTKRTLPATVSLRDFKKHSTELILLCKIKSLINPLMADHVTREANHNIRLLKKFKSKV